MNEAQEKKPENSMDAKFIITITLKLLLISAVTALMLAGVNALTAPIIAENNELEKKNAISAIFPNAAEIALSDIEADGADSIYLVNEGDKTAGYAASVSPNGFGGAIEIIVGINSDGKVAGIKIVSHSETPGLGSRIDSDGFLAQYEGLGGNIAIGREVDAITGSTISSKAVTDGVNSALSVYDMVFAGGME